MDRRTLLQLITVAGIAGFVRPASAGSTIAIIVNPKNPVRSLGAGEIEAIFTTRKLDWPDGSRIVPFNCPPRHPLRSAFDTRALHLDGDDAARYWIDRRIRGGHPPPRQVTDVATMQRVVAALETAVGYVRFEEVDATVRVVAQL